MKNILVSCKWLKQNIGKVRVFDCTWYLPNSGKNGYNDFLKERIPSASYIDLEDVSDPDSAYDHQIAPPEHVNKYFSELGLKSDDDIVVYDNEGSLYVACRMYYMFQYYGIEGNCYILNGGFPSWKSSKFDVEKGKPKVYEKSNFKFTGKGERNRFIGFSEIQKGLEGDMLILDARNNDRFTAACKEPRPVPAGHMPGSKNLFFKLFWNDMTANPSTPGCRELKPEKELRKIFEEAKVPLDNKTEIAVSCGSGVTACVIGFALDTLRVDFKVYDGSWAEYSQQKNAKIVTGK